MDNPIILVVDGDSKNLQILKESLESNEFKVLAADDGISAWETILTQKPDIIVSEVDLPGMNGFQLLAKLQKDPVCASIPLVFLTNRRDLADRLKSLGSGVKDYMIKPLHVKEVIARIKMILRRLERTKSDETDSGKKIIGRLEDKNVEELVESCGAERRTGILSVYSQNNLNGEIYFRDGAVVNARIGNFRAEKAVYQMLPWRQGHFVLTFKDINVEDEITVSNLGLLLQGFKRLQDRERLTKQLPSLDCVFVKTPIFEQVLKKKRISTDAHKFISLFDGRRTVSDIISESIYDDLKTLEKTAKLYEQGFIKPTHEETHPRREAEPKASKPKPEERKSKPKFETKPQIPEPPKIPKFKEETIKPDIPAFNPEPAKPPFEKETPEPSEPSVEKENKEDFTKTPVGPKIPPFDLDSYFKSQEKAQDSSASVNGEGKREAPERDETLPKRKETTEFSNICDNLFNGRGFQKGHLIIISSDNDYRRQFISALTKGQISKRSIDDEHRQSIEIGTIVTSNHRTVEILGLSTESKFLQLLEHVTSSLVGYAILVPGDNPPDLGYLGYLINSLKRKFDIPHVIATYKPAGKKSMPLDVLRYSLKMEENEQLVEVNVDEVDSIKHLLNQLIPPKYVKEPKSREYESQNLAPSQDENV